MQQEQLYFSAGENTFVRGSRRSVYERAGSWPADAQPVSDAVFREFGASPSQSGKIRTAGDDGMPVWVDPAPPPPEFFVATAEGEKQRRLSRASREIDILQDAVNEGSATEAEISRLSALRAYRVTLNRVSTDAGADTVFPDPPPQ